mgnify:CR=1 FL=1
MQAFDSEIYKFLKEQSERNGGTLPELTQIAWHAYVGTMFVNIKSLNHWDYEKFWEFFPNFDTDPDCNDPVLAIAVGKHYFDPDPSIPEGECLYETEFEGFFRQIGQDKKKLGGELTPGFTAAWSGKLLGEHDSGEITDEEYERLKAMLPVLDSDPVKEVEAATRKYLDAR